MSNSYVRMYETKVIRRNFLHLYRSFGWLPVSKIKSAPHDWERANGYAPRRKRNSFVQRILPRRNRAQLSTMPNNYPNLSDPNDVGQKFYEMIMIRRNVKYHEKGDKSALLRSHERRFNRLMWYMKAHHVFFSVLIALPLLFLGIFTAMSAVCSFLQGNVYFLKELYKIICQPVMYAFGIKSSMIYGIICLAVTLVGHLISRWLMPIFPASRRYRYIQEECLAAREIVKEIQLEDISLMTKSQRERYESGRVMSSAMSNALLQQSNDIYDDFFLGA